MKGSPCLARVSLRRREADQLALLFLSVLASARALEHIDVGLGVLGHVLQRVLEHIRLEVDALARPAAVHPLECLLVPLFRPFALPELLEVVEEADHALLGIDLRGVDFPEHRAGSLDVLGFEFLFWLPWRHWYRTRASCIQSFVVEVRNRAQEPLRSE